MREVSSISPDKLTEKLPYEMQTCPADDDTSITDVRWVSVLFVVSCSIRLDGNDGVISKNEV